MIMKPCKAPGPNYGNVVSCWCLSKESHKLAYLYQFKWGYECKIINEDYQDIQATEWDDICREFLSIVLNYYRQQKTKYEQYENQLIEFIKESQL